MTKKTTTKKYSWLNWISKIRVEDLLLIILGIIVFMIIITIAHYSLPGEKFSVEELSALPIVYYFDFFVKATTFRYVFFVFIPLLVVWIAKLFQKKTWNIKKAMIWLGIGIVIMLLIYFGLPSRAGFENIPKAQTPDVKMFVMSFCPFGQQAETALKTVQELFGSKVVIEPHFIINDLSYREEQPSSGCIKNNTLCSLHGINELNENMRQMCIWKYYQDKWWDYILCINDICTVDDVETCWKECAEDNEISVGKIRACKELEGISLAEKDRDLSDELKAYSSPTIIINNATYQGRERTPEILKKAICKGFEKPPVECETKLKEDNKVTGSNVKKVRKAVFEEEVVEEKDKCTEEGVCPQTGEKTIPEQGEKDEKEE